MLNACSVSSNIFRSAALYANTSRRGQRLLSKRLAGCPRTFATKPQAPPAAGTAGAATQKAGTEGAAGGQSEPPPKRGGFGLGSAVLVAGLATAGSVAGYTYSPEFRQAADKCPVPAVSSFLKQASDSADGILKDAKALVGLDAPKPPAVAGVVPKPVVPKKEEVPKPPTVARDAKREAPAARVVKTEKKVAVPEKRPEAAAPAKTAEVAPAVAKEEAPAPAPAEKTTASVQKQKSELDIIQQKGKEMRLETMKRTTEAVLADSTALRKELEGSLLRDMEKLDEAGLRYRIIQLAAELQERTKWEALRLHESLKQAQEESSRRYNDLLRQQREMFEETLAKEVRQTETRVLDAAAEEMGQKLSDLKKEQQQAYQDFTSKESGRLSGEFLAQYNAEVERARADYMDQTERRIEAMKALEDEVAAIKTVLDQTSSYFQTTNQVNKVSAATLALAQKLETSAPVSAELALLKRAASGDPLLTTVTASLEGSGKKGVPTVDQLKVRFDTVRSAARKAALIPETTDGVLGQLLGSLLAFVTIQPVGNVQGSGAEETLARTAYLLELGDLKSAISELGSLKGNGALIVRDWIKDAKARLQAEQAVKIFNAHAALLNERLL